MSRIRSFPIALLLCAAAAIPAAADDKEATAIVDKAVKALGGEAKLSKAQTYATKGKATISINGSDNEISSSVTTSGIDKRKTEFSGEFGGNRVEGTTVLNADRAWRKFGDNAMELEGDAVANEKRIVYLSVVATHILPLKGKDFKIKAGESTKIDDKAVAVLEVVGPDSKEFKLYFDKESGLPVRMTARVPGWNGEEYDQENNYSAFKEFDGIKVATKVESKRNGEKFVTTELTEFKTLEKADSDAFAEPK